MVGLTILTASLLITTTALFAGRTFTPTWSTTVLTRTFHVGDDEIKAYEIPRPNSVKFQSSFTLPSSVKHDLVNGFTVIIDVADIVPFTPKNSKAHRHGIYNTKLFVNGIEIAIINKFANGPERAQKVERLRIPLPGTALRDGLNSLEIVPGMDARNRDDFELHRIEINNGMDANDGKPSAK